MRTNYHTHTFRCGHASGTEEDYILEAIDKDISILGISDHCPFKGDKYGFRMEYKQLNDYINTIKSLRDKHKDKIEIKLGVEIEFDENKSKYYEELLKDLDYLLLGQHFYINEFDALIDVYDLNRTMKYIEYAKSIEKAIKSGYFKMLAHPDIVFINDLPFDDNCKKACEIIINAALENDFILEFNANGIRRGKFIFNDGERYQYPYLPFWEMVAKTHVKVLVNSDCHEPEQLWDEAMVNAINLAKSLQLNVVNNL